MANTDDGNRWFAVTGAIVVVTILLCFLVYAYIMHRRNRARNPQDTTPAGSAIPTPPMAPSREGSLNSMNTNLRDSIRLSNIQLTTTVQARTRKYRSGSDSGAATPEGSVVRTSPASKSKASSRSGSDRGDKPVSPRELTASPRSLNATPRTTPRSAGFDPMPGSVCFPAL